jgi:hypothetical protein
LEIREGESVHFRIDRRRVRRHAGFMFSALALLLVVVAYRVACGFLGSGDLAWMNNFAPVAAIALCGAVYLPRRLAIALPLVMLVVSDVILNVGRYHEPLFTWDILPRYAALALISMIGFALRGRARFASLLGASVAGSVLFYLVTNTGSWISEPGYTKDLAGWMQAQTTGLPGFVPSLWFFRQTLLSDACFTVLFAACMALQPRARAVAAPAGREEFARP